MPAAVTDLLEGERDVSEPAASCEVNGLRDEGEDGLAVEEPLDGSIECDGDEKRRVEEDGRTEVREAGRETAEYGEEVSEEEEEGEEAIDGAPIAEAGKLYV